MSNVAAGKTTDDEGEALNDVEKTLKKLNIRLRDSAGEWRNFEHVLDEVAEKWNNGVFNEVEKSQIATAIAGVRQQENFRALMNNWETVSDLTKVAADSTGSASQRMEIYLDSVEAKTNELKATWEQFIMSLNQSESWKDFLDLCIWLLNNMPTVIGLLTSFFLIFKGGKLFSTIGGGISTVTETMKTFFSLVKETKVAGTGFIGTLKAMKTTITGLSSSATLAAAGIGLLVGAITLGVAAYKKYKQAQFDSVSETSEQAKSIREEVDSLDNVRTEYTKIIQSSASLADKKKQLASIQSTLSESFDIEKNKIDLVNGSYKEQIALLNQIEKEKITEEANKYNQNADSRSGLLDDHTMQIIKDFNPESEAGKLLESTVKKYDSGFGAFTTRYVFNGIFAKQTLDASISTTAENLVKIYNELQKESKNLSQSAQEELGRYLSASNWLNKSMKEDYEKYSETYNEEQKARLANFKKDNYTAYSNYKSHLLAIQNLQEQYNLETSEERKKEIAQEIEELDKKVQETKNILYGLTDDKTILEGLDTLFNSLSKYSLPKIDFKTLNIDGVNDNFLDGIKKELETTGTISESTRGKILEVEEAMNGEDVDSSWLGTFNNELKDIGVNIDKLKLSKGVLSESYNAAELAGMYSGDVEGGGNSIYEDSLGHARIAVKNNTEYIANNEADKAERAQTGREWTVYNEEHLNKLKAELTKYENIAMSYFQGFYDTLDSQLQQLGINGNDVVISNLKKELATGQIEIDSFYSQLSEYLKKLGIDIENLTQNTQNNVSEMDFNFDESVGTDAQFKNIIDVVDKLYSMKKTLSDGDFLNYEDFRYLTDNFEGLTDIVAKYGDITDLTASDIQDIIDELTEKTEEDLEKMEDLFDETLSNIDNIVNKANFGDDFSKTLEDTFNDATKALEKGEKLSFLDPDVVSDAGALTEYANEIDAVASALDNMSISAEDAQGKLYMLSLETLDAQTQADAFGMIVDLLGTDFFNLDTDIQNALIDLGLYNQETGMADSTQMVATLTNIANNFDNADTKTQEAYTSLISYIAAINQAENASPTSGELANLVASGLGEIKAAARVGARESRVRKAGLNGSNRSGKAKGSGGSKYTAEDAASDLKDILQDIEGYEADIELDLEDQTEQFINQEMLAANRLDRLKKELDYYSDIYDVTEETSKWLETQNKILDNQSKKVGKLQQASRSIEAQREKLYSQNSGYNIKSWFDSEGNDTLAYGDLINSFAYQKNAIEKETAQKMREVYNSVAGSTNKEAIQDAKDKIKQIEEEADIRIEALDKEQEKIENIHDSVGELNEAWLDNQEAIREALAELHDKVVEIRDELLDDITEQLEKAVDKQNESLEKDATRIEQFITIQEKYNDILNETLDTQDELDSELRASLDSFEYLDEQMRELMFNEEDYKILSETLTGIQEDIADIWSDHYDQINSLTDEEMYKAEYITAETERQLEMKMKEYELAKAELEVAKARTNLQNVQNERNVRMFVGGQWQWVADPNAVKDAQQQLADAEREKDKIEREGEQQILIDKLNRIVDSDNLQIDKNNELLERIEEAIEAELAEVKNIEQALTNASGEDLPALNDVLQGAFGTDGGIFKELMNEINRGQTELALALKGTTIAQAEAQLKSGNLSQAEFDALRTKLGYGWDEKTGIITTQDGSFSAHYKGWKPSGGVNTPLHTGENGASVTGGGSSANTTQPPAAAPSGFPKSGRVSTSSLPLRIRSGAGTNYKVLGSMPKGASVEILGEANSGWAKVRYKGISGYASKQYLTYDQGGLANGKGIFLKDINLPERVLSPQQTKSFDTLVKNLTTNPVLAALTKNIKGTSNWNGTTNGLGETKQYYFSNFTVQADNITEFIDSIEGMMPIANK